MLLDIVRQSQRGVTSKYNLSSRRRRSAAFASVMRTLRRMCARPDVQLARLQQAETHEEERRHTFRSAPPSNFYRRRAIRDNMGYSNADAAQAMDALTSLHFHGPFTLVDHDGSGIAKSEFAHSQGIYLWVQTDGTSRYIHYIGQTPNFLGRHKDHLFRILGFHYGLFRADAVTANDPGRIFDGMWRLTM